MYKLIEMKERVREFEYKWRDKDRTKPLLWDRGEVLNQVRNYVGLILMNYHLHIT